MVSLADSPVPRFDLLKLDRYTTATLQFSRGCPFLCEFCDIIVMFGRKPRYKTLDQVGRELDALRARNVHSVGTIDDDGIWKGSTRNERSTNTTSSTGKNERAYSTTSGSRGCLAIAAW